MISEMETMAAWALSSAEETYETNLAGDPAAELSEMYFAMSVAGIEAARAELVALGKVEPLSGPTTRIGGLPVRCDPALEVDWQLRPERKSAS